MSDHDRDDHRRPRTINIEFLLDEISERAREMEKEYIFPDEIHKAYHDGQLKELFCIAALIKSRTYLSTGHPINIAVIPPGNPNDPNLFTINDVGCLVRALEERVCCLQRETVFPDIYRRGFHDGQLAELVSLLALVKSQIYED